MYKYGRFVTAEYMYRILLLGGHWRQVRCLEEVGEHAVFEAHTGGYVLAMDTGYFGVGENKTEGACSTAGCPVRDCPHVDRPHTHMHITSHNFNTLKYDTINILSCLFPTSIVAIPPATHTHT